MLNKIAQLEYLSSTIDIVVRSAKETSAGINKDSGYTRGLHDGREMVVNNLEKYVAELESLVQEVKELAHKPYMVEDINFYEEGEDEIA